MLGISPHWRSAVDSPVPRGSPDGSFPRCRRTVVSHEHETRDQGDVSGHVRRCPRHRPEISGAKAVAIQRDVTTLRVPEPIPASQWHPGHASVCQPIRVCPDSKKFAWQQQPVPKPSRPDRLVTSQQPVFYMPGKPARDMNRIELRAPLVVRYVPAMSIQEQQTPPKIATFKPAESPAEKAKTHLVRGQVHRLQPRTSRQHMAHAGTVDISLLLVPEELASMVQKPKVTKFKKSPLIASAVATEPPRVWVPENVRKFSRTLKKVILEEMTKEIQSERSMSKKQKKRQFKALAEIYHAIEATGDAPPTSLGDFRHAPIKPRFRDPQSSSSLFDLISPNSERRRSHKSERRRSRKSKQSQPPSNPQFAVGNYANQFSRIQTPFSGDAYMATPRSAFDDTWNNIGADFYDTERIVSNQLRSANGSRRNSGKLRESNSNSQRKKRQRDRVKSPVFMERSTSALRVTQPAESKPKVVINRSTSVSRNQMASVEDDSEGLESGGMTTSTMPVSRFSEVPPQYLINLYDEEGRSSPPRFTTDFATPTQAPFDVGLDRTTERLMQVRRGRAQRLEEMSRIFSHSPMLHPRSHQSGGRIAEELLNMAKVPSCNQLYSNVTRFINGTDFGPTLDEYGDSVSGEYRPEIAYPDSTSARSAPTEPLYSIHKKNIWQVNQVPYPSRNRNIMARVGAPGYGTYWNGDEFPDEFERIQTSLMREDEFNQNQIAYLGSSL